MKSQVRIWSKAERKTRETSSLHKGFTRTKSKGKTRGTRPLYDDFLKNKNKQKIVDYKRKITKDIVIRQKGKLDKQQSFMGILQERRQNERDEKSKEK